MPNSSNNDLQIKVARNLSVPHIAPTQMTSISPRWLLKFMPWVGVEGIYRINQTKIILREGNKINCSFSNGKYNLQAESLRAIPMFSLLTINILEQLTSKFVYREYDMKQTIVSEGEQGDAFFIIAKGKVEMLMEGDSKEELRMGVLGEGKYFGEVDMYEDLPSDSTVRTLAHTGVLVLSKVDCDSVMDQSSQLRDALKKAVQERQDTIDRVSKYGEKAIELMSVGEENVQLPETFVDYEEVPREIDLSAIQTVLRIPTRIQDIYNNRINQAKEQFRLTIESIKEKQESEIINNKKFGLIHTCHQSMKLTTLFGPPTPDDLDSLITLVWKKPAFFIAHPRAIAAFGRECTRRGVPPVMVHLFGAPFMTWRGIPIVPSDKVEIRSKTRNPQGPGLTDIILVRVGEQEQGVIGLFQKGLQYENHPSLNVVFNGIGPDSIANYLLSLYYSCVALTEDAIAVLENVEIGYFHDYAADFRK